MSDESAQLKRAQDLVKSGDYEEARQILLTLPEHPTAQKWLKQLDERYPTDSPNGDDAILRRAQALIEAEQHDDAIALLREIPHHPTAQQWLNRLKNLESSGQGVPTMSDDQIPTPIFSDKSATDYTVPMLPPVVDIVQEQIIKRLGKVGGVAAVGALLYGLISAIQLSLDLDSTFVLALVSAIFTALFTYGVSFALSLAFPTISRNTFFAYVGFATALAFLSVLLVSGSSTSLFLTRILQVLSAFGVAYIFSKLNRFVPAQGETRFNFNLFVLVGIALFGLELGGSGLITLFALDSRFGGLGLGTFVGGLLGGAVLGALIASSLAIGLSESE
jgi:tetratricopeptide (TPR) repeat protein